MKSSNQDHKIELMDPTQYVDEFGDLFDLEDGPCPPDAISFPNIFLDFPLKEVGDFRGVSQKIKAVRKAFGITQKQMASVLNMSQQAYCEIEKDGNQILPKTLVPIAAFFNISFSFFFGFTNQFLLLQSRNAFFKVNGFCLLDFVSQEKIKEVMTQNCDVYHFEEFELPLEEAYEEIKTQEFYESYEHYLKLKKKFET